MLLQITNKCSEGCEHCLQSSSINGLHMSIEVFKHALEWIIYGEFSLAVVSGGEPTESPFFSQICFALDYNRIPFTIVSNGTWCQTKTELVYDILKLQYCVGMQVYSNPKWYKDYEMVTQSKSLLHNKISLVTTDIQSMQDLGRARISEKAQKEVQNNTHAPSCLKCTVLSRQVKSLRELNELNARLQITRPGAALNCTPLVDYKGEVHMSESHFCPSCGNVAINSFDTIWNNMHTMNPCMACKVSKKFFNSGSLNAISAKTLLNLR